MRELARGDVRLSLVCHISHALQATARAEVHHQMVYSLFVQGPLDPTHGLLTIRLTRLPNWNGPKVVRQPRYNIPLHPCSSILQPRLHHRTIISHALHTSIDNIRRRHIFQRLGSKREREPRALLQIIAWQSSLCGIYLGAALPCHDRRLATVLDVRAVQGFLFLRASVGVETHCGHACQAQDTVTLAAGQESGK